MQFSKSFLAVCVATLGIVPLSLPAADTDAQIRARDALEKKLNEMQVQEPVPTQPKASPPKKPKKQPAAKEQPAPKAAEPRPVPPAQPSAPPVVEPTPAPAPAVTTPPPTVTLPPTVEVVPPPSVRYVPGPLPRQDSEAIAKAREALRQKLNDLQTQPPPAPAPAPPPPVVNTPPPQPAPTMSKAEQKRRAAEEANARKAAEKQAKEDARTFAASAPPTGSTPGTVQNPPPPPEPRPAPPQKHPVVKGQTQFPAIEGPPLPINTDKQGRLNELLRKYRADEISPEQYHAERAKILAEP